MSVVSPSGEDIFPEQISQNLKISKLPESIQRHIYSYNYNKVMKELEEKLKGLKLEVDVTGSIVDESLREYLYRWRYNRVLGKILAPYRVTNPSLHNTSAAFILANIPQ